MSAVEQPLLQPCSGVERVCPQVGWGGRVLLVTGSDEDVLWMRSLFGGMASGRYALERADGHEAGLAQVRAGRHQAYLVAARLGARSGLELVREARSGGCGAPLLVPGSGAAGGEEEDAAALEAGAAGFLARGELTPQGLERTLRYALAHAAGEDALRARGAALEGVALATAARERLSSVGALVAGLTHELNNPLSFIRANLAFALEELRPLASQLPPGLHGELLAALGEASDGARRVQQALGDVRAFARADGRVRPALDVLPVLQLALRVVSYELRHRAELACELGPLPRVDADEARLGQLFLGLLAQATLAIPEGAPRQHRVRVRTATGAGGEALVEVQGSTARGAVRGGVGAAQALGESLARALGGRLEVEREGGPGTTWRVHLPPSRHDTLM